MPQNARQALSKLFTFVKHKVTQPTFTCFNLTVKALEESVKVIIEEQFEEHLFRRTPFPSCFWNPLIKHVRQIKQRESLSLIFKDIKRNTFLGVLQGFNHLSTNPTKWSNTLKQFVGCCWQICVFDHFWDWRLNG